MNENSILITSILKDIFGTPRKNRDDIKDVEFNCPSTTCRNDTNKFNLTYNVDKKIFHCWKCGYRGTIFTLIREYGSKEQYERLKILLPFFTKDNLSLKLKSSIDYDLITCKLPEDYRPLTKSFDTKRYKEALDYVLNVRKIDWDTIIKYKIGYTEAGERKNRIIIPSYNSIGRLNYFEARSFLENEKIKYYKPKNPDKNDIIFNESNVNFDLPVYLVEGPFDMLRIPNSIPMLGKRPSDLLISKLMVKNSKVVICLDEDALKDAIEIYEKLSSLGLDCSIIDMSDKGDISEIYENEGKEGILNILKLKTKIGIDYKLKKLLSNVKK